MSTTKTDANQLDTGQTDEKTWKTGQEMLLCSFFSKKNKNQQKRNN